MKTRTGTHLGLHYGIHEPTSAQHYVLYVHGGPGGHSGFFENALSWPAYGDAGLGWITYDQRGCGRSRDDAWEMTHERNLADLHTLYLHLTETEKLNVVAIVGHSYGGKLVLDFRCNGACPKYVVLGIGFAPFAPRNRSLMMDLFALKTKQPAVYETLYGKLIASSDLPWRMAVDVRRAMHDLELRKYFYWANLKAMDWYFGVKKTLPFDDNDTVFRKVRETVFNDDESYLAAAPKSVPSDTLWILGLHDFLMGGEIPEAQPQGVRSFRGSGHYPQFEEPERFVEELRAFLS